MAARDPFPLSHVTCRDAAAEALLSCLSPDDQAKPRPPMPWIVAHSSRRGQGGCLPTHSFHLSLELGKLVGLSATTAIRDPRPRLPAESLTWKLLGQSRM